MEGQAADRQDDGAAPVIQRYDVRRSHSNGKIIIGSFQPKASTLTIATSPVPKQTRG